MTDASLDKRRNAYRGDLAAEALRGKVVAPRYVAGEAYQVVTASGALRAEPDARAGWTTEALYGEVVAVYDMRDGWAWVQLTGDAYVGYLPAAALSRNVRQPTHRVSALGAALYPSADIKSCPAQHLSLNARLTVANVGQVFARLDDGLFVASAQIAERQRFAPDFVAVAEAFTGVPYLWGGKTRLGIDCSGLLQVALEAAGRTCPRDSDMQLAEVGDPVTLDGDLGGLRRGDIVFWSGHVGIMRDGERLLHANAHHMAVVTEPLRQAVDRIARAGSPITAVKRLAPAV
jgi:cell wall-associated NlpC family hydrolase